MIETQVLLTGGHELTHSIRDIGFSTIRQIYRPKKTAETVAAETPSDTHIIASVNGINAGTLTLDVNDFDLRIRGLTVLPNFRRLGVARAMVEAAAVYAIEHRCTSMKLFTIRETGNVEIFTRLGFTVIGVMLADWCESDRFKTLHEVEMARSVLRQ